MSETTIIVPHGLTSARLDKGRSSLRRRRYWLTSGGLFFFACNVVLLDFGVDVGPAAPFAAYIGAVGCLVAAFIVFMMEPPRDAAEREGEGEASQGGAGSDPSAAVEARPALLPVTLGGGSANEPPREEKPQPLVRPGNRLRLARGGITALAASFFTVVLMGKEGQWRWGVPLGALLVSIASWGVMDLLGTFDDADDRVVASRSIAALARPLLACVGAWVLFCLTLGFATAGLVLPPVAWGFLITAAFVGAVALTFQLGVALGAWKVEVEGGLLKRHGFWVVTLAAALFFPFMGTSSLWDPWETHYGEVAREMLARDDWISLWWAQDGWFWSKPVLDMWMQAIAMATLGVHYQPDKMLIGNGTSPIMHPEWAVRAPVVLITILAMYLLYKGVAKTFGRRAALLGSVALATMPDWYMLAHQTMTDMPCVAAMTACMGLVMIGLRTPETSEAQAYEVVVAGRRFRLTGWHLVFGSLLVCAIPQILYLLSRNVEFLWRSGAHGFHYHWDEFRSGSGGGNCGLPGNEECRSSLPAFIPHSVSNNPSGFGLVWRTLGAFEPAVQALLWTAVLGVALYLSWGERRTRRLYYLAAWFFAALSTLAKGPEGIGLPVLVTLLYLSASRPGEELFGRIVRLVRELTQLEIVAGLAILLAVGMPWYVAMYVRHGAPFTDRLIFHDMFNRAFHHVHDTNEGDDTSFRFYIWQLGYALFPWTGFAPLGLLWWLRRGTSGRDTDRGDTSVLLCMWCVLAFALFSFMGTKFHHYIFPAVPPIAMLVGIVLDDMLGDVALTDGRSLAVYLSGLVAGAALMVFGLARTMPGSFFGFKAPASPLTPGSPLLGSVLFVLGVGLTAAVVRTYRKKRVAGPTNGVLDTTSAPIDGSEASALGDTEDDASEAHTSRMLAAGAIAGALLLIVVGRDLVFRGESADQPGAIRLLQLFTYNYRRPWPDSLDFTAALTAFTAVASLVSLALAFKSVRAHAVAVMCAVAFVWGVWGTDVYMQRTAQHWGQHEVIEAYYRERQSPQEMLIAYQMNWKGENFYTGNHIPAYVATGAAFTAWLKKQRETGTKVMFFVTEAGRVGGLKSEVAAKSYREITDKTLCNKFTLVRAEL